MLPVYYERTTVNLKVKGHFKIAPRIINENIISGHFGFSEIVYNF